MTRIVTKTTFQEFLYCPKNIWLKLHKPELLDHFTLSDFELHLMEQGNEVESYARNLFPSGVEIVASGEAAVSETIRLMASGITCLFQATFIEDGFLVRNDVLKHDPLTNTWDLYEIKATNSIKENTERDHIADITFQASVLRRAGITLGKCFHVCLNKDYVRSGDLDINALFKIEDVTERVEERMQEVESQMEIARQYLNKQEEPPGGCECVYGVRSKHCTTFKYSNPHIPDYSVHDLTRIHKTKLLALLEKKIYKLSDIEDPVSFKLTDKHKNQILAHKLSKPIIDTEQIHKELSALAFPLYFLDYEAFGPAIPEFNGYRPYQHIPFQFSLHIMRTPHSKLEHVEYLHTELSDPTKPIAELLKSTIVGGTVISWYKHYEKRINKEIGERRPEYADFFSKINEEMYDLMDIFLDQHYIHNDFKGKTSIKIVLPVIAPELTYSDLEIHGGAQASNEWWKMVGAGISESERDAIRNNLRTYCTRDTYAMCVIWNHLQELVA
jgi:hypothetical protein